MRKSRAFIAGIAFSLCLALPVQAQQATDTVQPEPAIEAPQSLVAPGNPVIARNAMVVAAHPLAAEAGLAVLAKGGTAADALVAVQTVLGLVEPQSSGLGGGAFLVWRDGKTGAITTFDGRETAPSAATADLFRLPDGKPMQFFDAVIGGRSVGVPGTVRLMEAIHKRSGALDWQPLFDPAIRLAEDGFAVSPRLAGQIALDKDRLAGEATTRTYFLDANGEPLKAGTLLKNRDYAATLRSVAQAGADAFYDHAIADQIVDSVRLHPRNPGLITFEDMQAYKVIERAAVCAPYRGHEVCGMGPPSSGALTIGQILGLVEGFDLKTLGADDPVAWRIIGDATRLAFADRERYIADSDFVRMPQGLLNRAYLNERAKLLLRDTALGPDEMTAGTPPWDKAELRMDGMDVSLPSTSHFTIIDRFGNIASVTSSIENGFGARIMAGGFLLNNQLTDFSFLPEGKDGAAVANRVEPGKRPRSSMSPTIILKDGKPVHVLGSPGGSRIIPYVAKTIIALIDWEMNIQQAVALPHLTNRFGTYDLEAGTAAEGLKADLEALGYKTTVTDLNSGLHGLSIAPDGTISGGADPRREGIAAGN